MPKLDVVHSAGIIVKIIAEIILKRNSKEDTLSEIGYIYIYIYIYRKHVYVDIDIYRQIHTHKCVMCACDVCVWVRV